MVVEETLPLCQNVWAVYYADIHWKQAGQLALVQLSNNITLYSTTSFKLLLYVQFEYCMHVLCIELTHSHCILAWVLWHRGLYWLGPRNSKFLQLWCSPSRHCDVSGGDLEQGAVILGRPYGMYVCVCVPIWEGQSMYSKCISKSPSKHQMNSFTFAVILSESWGLHRGKPRYSTV